MSRLHTGANEWAQGSLAQRKTGLEIKVARKWLPTPAWMLSTPSVLTKPSGSRSWTAAYIIERIYNLSAWAQLLLIQLRDRAALRTAY
jgi:hypothetical protein